MANDKKPLMHIEKKMTADGFIITSNYKTFWALFKTMDFMVKEMREFAEVKDEKIQSQYSEALMELIDDMETASDRIESLLENRMPEAEAKPFFEEDTDKQ